LRGKMAGRDYTREIQLTFPEAEAANDVLATVWARTRVDELMSKYYGAKDPDKKAIEDEITQLGLEFGIMTQFTSFVAVEERIVNQDGKQVRIEVPVDGPAGTVYSAVGDLAASVTVTGGAAAGNTSTQFFSNVPTGRTTQGLYTVAPTVARSGIRDATVRNRDPSVAGSTGPENSYVIDGTTNSTIAQSVNVTAAPAPAAPSWPGINNVLKRMDAHQLALKTLSSDIKITTFDAKLNKSADRRGQLIYQSIKTNPSVRVDLEEPKESISLINGNYSIYFPELRQYRTGKPRDAAMVRGLAFLNIPGTELKANYTIDYIGGENVSPGLRTWHFELKPKNGAEFKSVHLWINSDGLPVQLKFVEQDDDILTLLITNPEKNIPLKPEDFQIEIPEDTKPMPDEVPVTP
jgi:outer membrane lipoprotein-sorting protein